MYVSADRNWIGYGRIAASVRWTRFSFIDTTDSPEAFASW